MKDLKIIVRYAGLERLPDLDTPLIPIIGEPPAGEYVFRILMGFAGEQNVQTYEHREPSRPLALLYPENPENQFVIALGSAIRAAASELEALVVVNQATPKKRG